MNDFIEMQKKIKQLKKEKNAVILAHTYQDGLIQDCADYVGDSYGLSVEVSRVKAETIIFCGVRFMAETAVILNSSRTVILPEPGAGCPMAAMISPDELITLKADYPGYCVMCYVNSTAEIKALSDVCCTSTNAVRIAQKLPDNQGIIFVPDRHLGSFVQEQTGKKMVLWEGCCPVHMRLTPQLLADARKRHPNAVLLIHPEATHECRKMSDAVLSTGGMLEFVNASNTTEFIIATENGLIHTLSKSNPDKRFYKVSEDSICPDMKLGTLESLYAALNGTGGEIVAVAPDIAQKARFSLEKMLELS